MLLFGTGVTVAAALGAAVGAGVVVGSVVGAALVLLSKKRGKHVAK